MIEFAMTYIRGWRKLFLAKEKVPSVNMLYRYYITGIEPVDWRVRAFRNHWNHLRLRFRK
jgi:hypothetical protein